MRGLIDWELLSQLHDSPRISQPDMWDAFAARYDGYCRLQQHHTRLQLDFMALQADETLLDVGAGTGRISIPAAGLVRHVTALDTSSGMQARLNANAAASGVQNITPCLLPWEKVEPGVNLEQHDVVLAARSPAMSDLRKLDALARRAVYVMFFCGPSLKQFHDSLVAGIDSFPSAGPTRSAIAGHALIFNRLVDMGIEAQVSYLEDGFSKYYPDVDAAVADFDWLALPAGSQDRLRANLSPYLRPEGTGLRLLARTRTAVVWWHKQRPVIDRFGAAQ